jgi:hypothetical protein
MAQAARRAKSNTLFRLVKSLSFGQFTKLKAYNDVYAKGSKQWRLIEYYYHLSEWSREKELADWPEGRLAALKYDTLQWMFKAMSRVGEWPGHDLFHAYGDVAMAVKRNVFASADEFWTEAKPTALNEERFGLILEFLALEREIIRSGDTPDEVPARLARNLKLSQDIIALQSEVLKLEELQSLYFDPIKIQHRQNGMVSKDQADSLRGHLQQIKYKGLKCVRSRHAYLRMQVFIDLLGGLENAEHSITQLVEMQTKYAWLREDDLGRFFIDVRSAIFIASSKGQVKRIAELRRLFDLYDFEDPWIFSIGVVPKVESLLWTGMFLNSKQDAEQALSMLKANNELVKREASKPAFIRVIHYAAMAAMRFGDAKDANRWLDELLDYKADIKEDRIASARILQLMNLLVIEDDKVFIESKATTAAKFLKRSKETYPQLYAISLAIGRIARCGADNEAIASEVKRLLRELRQLRPETEASMSFEHFDYAGWFESYSAQLTTRQ